MPKVTDGTELTAAAAADVLYIVDVSDTTQNATGTSKKITQANLFTGPALTTPELTGYALTATVNAAVTGTYNLNLAAGNAYDLTLTGATTFSLSNPPASGKWGELSLILRQDATGGRAAVWPASVTNTVTLDTNANAVSLIRFVTTSGGATWLAVVVATGIVPLTTYLFDTFTDTNGTRITAHTPETDLAANGWTEQGANGNWQITTNQVGAAVTTNDNRALIDTGLANGTFSLKVTPGTSANDDRVIFRWSDASNYWYAHVRSTSDIFRLVKVVATVDTEVQTGSVTINDGTQYLVKVTTNGASITARLQDSTGTTTLATRTTTDSFNSTATQYGMKAGQTSSAFDDATMTNATA